MARIVKINPSPEVEEEIDCRDCGATIAYVGNDVKKYVGKDLSGGPDGREWIVCPNCTKDITIQSW